MLYPKNKYKKILTNLFLIFLALFISTSAAFLNAIPASGDIMEKGDRNLKIISAIYEKYSFMPAKKEYFRQIQEDWVKGKVQYSHAHPEEKKEKFDKLFKSYITTNDVLKDICIDMANLSEVVVDDFSQKLIDSETVKTNYSRDKHYNRYLVSRNELSRADGGFKRGMYYYSARLYDHGIDIMKNIYHERGWVFPKAKAQGKESLS